VVNFQSWLEPLIIINSWPRERRARAKRSINRWTCVFLQLLDCPPGTWNTVYRSPISTADLLRTPATRQFDLVRRGERGALRSGSTIWRSAGIDGETAQVLVPEFPPLIVPHTREFSPTRCRVAETHRKSDALRLT
jgi:hypothetical protein